MVDLSFALGDPRVEYIRAKLARLKGVLLFVSGKGGVGKSTIATLTSFSLMSRGFKVGCKGPVAHCPWNRVGWVNGVGGPTRTGAVCIGCTEPGFTDSFEPFYEKLPYVGVARETLRNVTVATLGATAVAGAVAGIWALLRGRGGGSGVKEGDSSTS